MSINIYTGTVEDCGQTIKTKGVEETDIKANDYHQVVHKIDHMSDLHIDSSFYKQSMKIYNYHKIKEWIDSSIGQSTVLQELDKKGLHYPT